MCFSVSQVTSRPNLAWFCGRSANRSARGGSRKIRASSFHSTILFLANTDTAFPSNSNVEKPRVISDQRNQKHPNIWFCALQWSQFKRLDWSWNYDLDRESLPRWNSSRLNLRQRLLGRERENDFEKAAIRWSTAEPNRHSLEATSMNSISSEQWRYNVRHKNLHLLKLSD